MKQLAAIFLILCLYSQNLAIVGYTAFWKLNQKAITQEFCVNKAKPQLKCNGKCHLKKQITTIENEKDESSQNRNIVSIKYSETVLFLTAIPNYEVYNKGAIPQNNPYNAQGNIAYEFLWLKAILHPPADLV